MAAPHAIHDDFPSEAWQILPLKPGNAHCACLRGAWDGMSGRGTGAKAAGTGGIALIRAWVS